MTGDATPAPAEALKPCPGCGGKPTSDSDRAGQRVRCEFPECWFGPAREECREAEAAWNALPRLVDGLRPEPAPQSLDAIRADLAWIRRALIALAERHGVTLPPVPAPRKAT